jgi:hypothetical protein
MAKKRMHRDWIWRISATFNPSKAKNEESYVRSVHSYY